MKRLSTIDYETAAWNPRLLLGGKAAGFLSFSRDSTLQW
nr:MAG TPA: hypothetical protein [Caudoviricetes sp.]